MVGQVRRFYHRNQVDISWPWELPASLVGTCVVVDIYAATTNMATILDQKPEWLMVVSRQKVLSAKKRYPHAVIIGEHATLGSDFFDVSNFPIEVDGADLRGKRVIYLTTNGVEVINTAYQKGAKHVLTVGFNHIQYTVDWLLGRRYTEVVTILSAGDVTKEEPRVEEDTIGAEVCKQLLLGEAVDWQRVFIRVRKAMERDYSQVGHLQQDLALLMDKNRYEVVPVCRKDEEGWVWVIDAKKTT